MRQPQRTRVFWHTFRNSALDQERSVYLRVPGAWHSAYEPSAEGIPEGVSSLVGKKDTITTQCSPCDHDRDVNDRKGK